MPVLHLPSLQMKDARQNQVNLMLEEGRVSLPVGTTPLSDIARPPRLSEGDDVPTAQVESYEMKRIPR